MALLRDRRPLKRWTYVGIYGPEILLCAAQVHVAGIPHAFWAVVDRADGALAQGTTFLPGRVHASRERLTVDARAVRIDLALERAGEPVEVTSPHGASYIWTRKDPVRATGTVTAAGRTHTIDGAGLVDASAGYHARVTAWEWSAGTGRDADGREILWNLVSGMHDAPQQSERTVWIDGRPQETPPVRFTGDLEGLACDADRTVLTFEPDAERARSENLLLVRSSYRQPMGSFSGTLPGGVLLAEGFGVMERHEARW
ncbi:unannotated protein [freshwater metagenome]|uniref:Unannotated protein n=1 Tax=freshwater metagenome TaxID=449393 RepID=A0A6J7CL88_9ZZZZ|nr:DUF2804 family protein [Actinomycetota bacterium]